MSTIAPVPDRDWGQRSDEPETIEKTPSNVFVSGEYLRKVPQWHTEDSSWKSNAVLQMIARNRLSPRTIGDVGCGAGEVLSQLQLQMHPQCLFFGYDIAPVAIELSRTRENSRLRFRLGEVDKDPNVRFDLLLILDVLEHQENYFRFLRELKPLAPYKIFHQILDLSIYALCHKDGLTMRRRMFEDLHFFTKDTALEALRSEGYETLDWFYAARSAYRSSGIKQRLRQLPRTLCYALHKDFAVRLLGGYSLFVLAR